MPHIRMRALKEEQVAELSRSLPTVLATTMKTSEDNFTFELIQTKYFAGGKISAAYPFIEVLWFERSQDVQNACAKIITEQVKTLNGENDVAVVFRPLKQTAYYENGEHF